MMLQLKNAEEVHHLEKMGKKIKGSNEETP